MKLDTVTLFKDDNNYFAIFINNIKVYENNSGVVKIDEIIDIFKNNTSEFNNKVYDEIIN